MIDLNRAAKLADELEIAASEDCKFFTPDPRKDAAKMLRDLVLENSSLQLRVAMATECLALAERKLENVKGMVAALGVPEGWKLVPVEPTEDMLDNVDQEVGGHCYSCTKWKASWTDCRAIWKEMLEVAPQPDAAITAQKPERCTSCDGTGDVIDQIGNWRGYCICEDGQALKAKKGGAA